MKALLINRAFEGTIVNTNKGMETILISVVQQLREINPAIQITTFMQIEPLFASHYDIKTVRILKPSSQNFNFFRLIEQILDLFRCILWQRAKKGFRKDLKFLLKSRRLKIVRETNVVIQTIADNYSDLFLPWLVQHSLDLLICKTLRKPFIFYGATIQIKSRFGKWICRAILNKADMIILRENYSKNILEAMGVTTPHYVMFDPAFYLEPSIGSMELKSFGMRKNNPVFGVCIGDQHPLLSSKKDGVIPLLYSVALYMRYFLPDAFFKFILRIAIAGPSGRKLNKNSKNYLANIAKLLDSAITEFNCDILLIPHHTNSEYLVNSDIVFYEKVIELVVNKQRVHFVRKDLTAKETKWIIGQSDIFVGGKLHACINSLSQCIPTVAISYAFKFIEIMRMMGQEKQVVQEFSIEETLVKIRYAWENRVLIRQELKKTMNDVQEQANTNKNILEKIVLDAEET